MTDTLDGHHIVERLRSNWSPKMTRKQEKDWDELVKSLDIIENEDEYNISIRKPNTKLKNLLDSI